MQPKRSVIPVSLLLCVLTLIAWSLFVWRSHRVFGPDSTYVQPFNSDSALPVLMANDPHIDPFRFYIYGQDQIGAWPFLMGQLVRRVTGFSWTPRAIHLYQVLWLSLSLLFVMGLCVECAWLPAILLAGTLVLHPTVAHYFFVLNQKNAWQVTAIFGAWFFYRQVCSRKQTDAIWWLHFVGAFVFSLFAIWASPISTPVLIAVFVFEFIRLCIVDEMEKRRVLPGVLSLVFAIIAEQVIKFSYHDFAIRHFGTDFKTPTELDRANLATNLEKQLDVLVSVPFWWVVVFALITAVGILVLLVTRRDLLVKESRIPLNLAVLICGCAVAAILNFAITVPFTWVRLNGYGPRYLAQTHFFGMFACLLSLVLLLNIFIRNLSARRWLNCGITVVALVVIAIGFPGVSRDSNYSSLGSIAKQIGQSGDKEIILGGYWDTYVFSGLAAPGKIISVPASDQLLRTPWSVDALHQAERILVVHHVFPPRPEVETPTPYDRFGDGQNPPSIINQYGVSFRLAEPKLFQQDGYVFSTYERVNN